jgi:hypothetical protein
MRKIRMSGSVGASGEQSPEATRRAPGKAWERRMGDLKPFVRALRVATPARKGWPAIRKRVLRGGGATHPAKRRQRVGGPCD